jgi:GH24 family phage-related lysozyme (muramidase)
MNTSTAARYLRAGKLKEACNELPKWDKARVAGVLVSLPGLTKRRALEKETCLQGI